MSTLVRPLCVASHRLLVSLVLPAFLLAAGGARAGVTVFQGYDPTNWSDTHLYSVPVVTVTNPVIQAVTGEGFTGNGGCTNLGQTFTIGNTNYILESMYFFMGGGTGTAPGTNLTLNLFDLGIQTPPNPSPYTASIIGFNMFGGGAGLEIDYSNQANSILYLSFNLYPYDDQVFLQAGHTYAIEFVGAFGTQPGFWFRTGADTYSGGAAYRNQTWINGNSARDFAFEILAYPVNAVSPLCTVDYKDVHQHIDGFGASSAYRSSWTTAQADMFFSTNTGIGLSLLRNHVQPDGTTVETNMMQMAQARGAKVWSATWSPPVAFKGTNANGVLSVNGGTFLGGTATNIAYASQLAGYVASMKQNYGVNIYALSVQNEPDFNTTSYDSCVWTPQQFHDFVPYLSSALAASNVASTKIMMPECSHWESVTNMYTTTMNDGAVAPLVSIIANHNYDGVTFTNGATAPPDPLPNYGKPTWETEVGTGAAFDGSISDGVYWGGRIQQFMTVAQANAWHYWWLISGNPDNEGLTDISGNPAKRMYVLGQFSRFVRPDFYRIGTTTTNNSGQISAYKDSMSRTFAIVAVNATSLTVTQAFSLTNFTVAGTLTPWITSSNQSLASLAAVTVSNSAFVYPLPPLSVMTFVGQASVGPTNIFLSASSISENLPAGTAVGSLTTGDPDTGNTFTYSLVSGTGSTDNSAFGLTGNTLNTAMIFDAAVQANRTIRVRSTDQNGYFVERTFSVTVTVNSAARRVVAASTTPGGVALTFSGIPNSTSRVQAATNLAAPVSWTTLTNSTNQTTSFTANGAGLWFLLDAGATNFPRRFYRSIEP